MCYVGYETTKVKGLKGGDKTLEVKESGLVGSGCVAYTWAESSTQVLRCWGQGPHRSCNVGGEDAGGQETDPKPGNLFLENGRSKACFLPVLSLRALAGTASTTPLP